MLPDAKHDVPTTWSRSLALPQRQVLCARIVLLAAEGVPNSSIAARPGCSQPTVRLWRKRFAAAGIADLEEDAPGRGRPALYDERTTAQVLSVTLGRPPKGEPLEQPCRRRTRGDQPGHGAAHLARAPTPAAAHPQLQGKHGPRARGQGHRCDRPLPASAGKAVVLGVDGKSQIQALDRTQPLLPCALDNRNGAPTTTCAMARQRS